jgi:LuxR family maltose regulon positive regulatory protein
LRRERLNARLAAVGGRELALVAAPAGAGKTTLVADWYTNHRTAAGAWLTLDARENEAGRFVALVAQALGCDVDAVEPGADPTVALDRVFDSMRSRATATVLVLDDVQELDSRAAASVLEHLVARMPPALSLVLVTRADPPIPIARLTVEGRVQQIRMDDLACTADEAADLLAAHGVELDRQHSNALWSRTEGWVAGLRLAALALADDANPQRLVTDAVRTELVVSDYLVHEVLDRLPADTQTFLLRTSVAHPLSPDLAAELSGRVDAPELLGSLERQGVFVSALGGDGSPQVYAFHGLFGALLRARLRQQDPALASALLRRAADWFAARDMAVEAESHARAACDWELAGHLACERWLRAAFRAPEFGPVAVEAPDSVCEEVASLALLRAVAATLEGDRAEATRWRARLDALAARTTSASSMFDDAPDPVLARAWPMLDLIYARAFGADVRALRAVKTLLADAERARPAALDERSAWRAAELARATVRFHEAELLLDSVETDAALEALFDARWYARGRAPVVVDEVDALLALVAASAGRVRAAERFLGSHDSTVGGETRSAFARRLAFVLCEVLRGRSVSARAHLGDLGPPPGISHAVRIAYEEIVDHLLMGGGRRSRVPAATHPFARRVRAALGVLDEPRADVAVSSLETLVARARLAHATANHDQVVALLAPVVDNDGSSGSAPHLRTRVEAHTLFAIASDRAGDPERAMAGLKVACDLAGAGDLRGPMVTYATDVAPLLERYSWRLATDTPYAVELVDVLQPLDPPVFVEPLTERERAVLEYLPTMMSNSEIAQQLLVSVNTVKTHLKSVYRKLGVERRRDAVLRGRQLEII